MIIALQKQFLLTFVFVCLLTPAFGKDFFISQKEIETQSDVNYLTINPIALSHEGDYFLVTERVKDLQTRAKGSAFNLLVFRFENGRLARIDKILLPITHLLNVAYAGRQHTALVSGDHGNKLILVNLRTNKIKTIFEYRKSRPGFKAGEMLLSNKGKFFSTGWFYDRNQYWKGDYLVRLRIDRKGKVKFEKKVDLEDLFAKRFNDQGLVRSFYYVSDQKVFFNLIRLNDRKTSLMMYQSKRNYADGECHVVDEGFLISVFVGTDKRVFYIVQDEDKNPSHYVKDVTLGKEGNLDSNKRWEVKGHGLYSYPFLVDDTLVAIRMNLQTRSFNGYYGKEEDGYVMKRFLKNEVLGPMKISGNGKTYLLITPEGFKIGNFELD